MKSRVVVLTLTVLFAAGATPAPMPSVPPGVAGAVQSILQGLAGDAAAPYGLDPNHVRGVVTFFQRFELQVRLPLNRYRAVHLHQGTVIDPRGATLTAGQVVDVQGRAQGDGSLDADTITIVKQ